ncbi:MAG: paraquat-inducible protein A [Pseudomonadota bacterium]
MTRVAASTMICHECDLVVDVPTLEEGQKAVCPRCGYQLAANRRESLTRLFAFSISALIFLALASSFPFLGLKAGGQEQSVTLLQSVSILFNEDHRLLSVVVFATIVGIPALILSGFVYASFAIRRPRGLPGVRVVLRWTIQLLPWSMAEIFLVGILVSFVKIVALADVKLGPSFWAYVLFTLSLAAVQFHLDRRELWRRIHGVSHG